MLAKRAQGVCSAAHRKPRSKAAQRTYESLAQWEKIGQVGLFCLGVGESCLAQEENGAELRQSSSSPQTTPICPQQRHQHLPTTRRQIKCASI
jgi:hypothetical protein